MAYPFAQAPRLRELIAKFEALGAEVRTSEADVRGPGGKTVIRYLVRHDDGILRSMYEPLPENDEARVVADTARRWCRQLDLDPRDLDIGLDLG